MSTHYNVKIPQQDFFLIFQIYFNHSDSKNAFFSIFQFFNPLKVSIKHV